MEDLSKAALQLDRAALMPQRITVRVTRDVAFNFDKMTQITKNVLGKLGCDGCHSGRVIDWLIIDDFIVNPKNLQVDEFQNGPAFRG